MSSAVNLPASLGPKEPAAIRPGSMNASDGSRLCADHAGILSLPVISLQLNAKGKRSQHMLSHVSDVLPATARF